MRKSRCCSGYEKCLIKEGREEATSSRQEHSVRFSAQWLNYTFKQPGTYVYLSHNLIEALLFGAISQIKVDGKE